MGSKDRITHHLRRPLPGLGLPHLDPFGPGSRHPPAGAFPFDMLPPLEIMEQKLAAQEVEMQTLATENQRIAATHSTLRQGAAQQELERLQTHMDALNAEQEQQIRVFYDKVAKIEADLQASESVKLELQQAGAEVQSLMENLYVSVLREVEALSSELSKDYGSAQGPSYGSAQVPSPYGSAQAQSSYGSTQAPTPYGMQAPHTAAAVTAAGGYEAPRSGNHEPPLVYYFFIDSCFVRFVVGSYYDLALARLMSYTHSKITSSLSSNDPLYLMDARHGLLLCTHEDERSYYVCNPAMVEWVTVPSIGQASHHCIRLFDIVGDLSFKIFWFQEGKVAQKVHQSDDLDVEPEESVEDVEPEESVEDEDYQSDDLDFFKEDYIRYIKYGIFSSDTREWKRDEFRHVYITPFGQPVAISDDGAVYWWAKGRQHLHVLHVDLADHRIHDLELPRHFLELPAPGKSSCVGLSGGTLNCAYVDKPWFYVWALHGGGDWVLKHEANLEAIVKKNPEFSRLRIGFEPLSFHKVDPHVVVMKLPRTIAAYRMDTEILTEGSGTYSGDPWIMSPREESEDVIQYVHREIRLVRAN